MKETAVEEVITCTFRSVFVVMTDTLNLYVTSPTTSDTGNSSVMRVFWSSTIRALTVCSSVSLLMTRIVVRTPSSSTGRSSHSRKTALGSNFWLSFENPVIFCLFTPFDFEVVACVRTKIYLPTYDYSSDIRKTSCAWRGFSFFRLNMIASFSF